MVSLIYKAPHDAPKSPQKKIYYEKYNAEISEYSEMKFPKFIYYGNSYIGPKFRKSRAQINLEYLIFPLFVKINMRETKYIFLYIFGFSDL